MRVADVTFYFVVNSDVNMEPGSGKVSPLIKNKIFFNTDVFKYPKSDRF
jgi:hypothetical protein